MQQLDNGNVFVGWGSEPYATELTASGRQVFGAKMATAQSYRAFRTPWTGMPATAPVIAVRRVGSGALDVYASWNGATEVVSWQVIAGSSNAVMTPVATALRKGFETTIHVRTSASKVAARALDRSGKLLAVSQSVSA